MRCFSGEFVPGIVAVGIEFPLEKMKENWWTCHSTKGDPAS
jgi:hypothetical protein